MYRLLEFQLCLYPIFDYEILSLSPMEEEGTGGLEYYYQRDKVTPEVASSAVPVILVPSPGFHQSQADHWVFQCGIIVV